MGLINYTKKGWSLEHFLGRKVTASRQNWLRLGLKLNVMYEQLIIFNLKIDLVAYEKHKCKVCGVYRVIFIRIPLEWSRGRKLVNNNWTFFDIIPGNLVLTGNKKKHRIYLSEASRISHVYSITVSKKLYNCQVHSEKHIKHKIIA